jgi:hypothetical protein
MNDKFFEILSFVFFSVSSGFHNCLTTLNLGFFKNYFDSFQCFFYFWLSCLSILFVSSCVNMYLLISITFVQ